MATVNSSEFYGQYHGHDPKLLGVVLEELSAQHPSVVYLAGDSSLDNKDWFSDAHEALNGYETVLAPPRMRADVAYWMNQEMVQRGPASMFCLNAAVEESTLQQRQGGTLLEQDHFIRDHISENDYLVVSVGGNDVVLRPERATISNLQTLLSASDVAASRAGTAVGMSHFLSMFGDRVQAYIETLLGQRKPRKVLVCMYYFPDEQQNGSWADPSLGLMGYNSDPSRLQAALEGVFLHATSRIRIPGVEVVPVPLFQALDGKDASDYVARVEPSAQGGMKMARLIMDAITAESAPPSA
jgi:hypothetical protein